MTAIPSVLSSAQTLLGTGFSKLDQAGAQIASSLTNSATTPTTATPTNTDNDPIVGGIVDTFQAREDVHAGAALLNTYQQMTNDLIEMSDPRPRSRYLDLYA